jgi:hypothetical protein
MNSALHFETHPSPPGIDRGFAFVISNMRERTSRKCLTLKY